LPTRATTQKNIAFSINATTLVTPYTALFSINHHIKPVVMRTPIFPANKRIPVFSLVIVSLMIILFQSCNKSEEAFETAATENELSSRRRPNPPPPPPPPPPFYFGTCWNPNIQGSFVAGVPTTATITLIYVNSPGGPHSGFTSTPVNGITLSTPPGVLTPGTGSIVYTASGTPVNSGLYPIAVSIGSSSACTLPIAVLNAPASGPTADPGLTPGSTGIINFTYKGQAVAYKTVRALDGKIWLQQNLGSPQVAFGSLDRASIGDYFQWGRWDDGHQRPNSPTITGGPSLMNPSHIASGNMNFIKGTTTTNKWWSVGGLATDTWSGTAATATNGKDPCVALGAGWRLPTAAEWNNIAMLEDMFGTMNAYQTNLKLPASGYRLGYDGMVFQNGDNGHYWTSTAAGNSLAKVFTYDDNSYDATTISQQRSQGYTCRCVKN
jgi:uncharacterized protein (TIGR02145 family)